MTSTLTPEDITRLLELEERATPGPWGPGEVRHAGRFQLVHAAAVTGFVCEVQAPIRNSKIDEETRAINTECIAAARNSLRPLCERVRELEAENERLRAALNSASGYLLNARIDLETGAPKATAIRTLEGGIRLVREALALSGKEGGQ